MTHHPRRPQSGQEQVWSALSIEDDVAIRRAASSLVVHQPRRTFRKQIREHRVGRIEFDTKHLTVVAAVAVLVTVLACPLLMWSFGVEPSSRFEPFRPSL